VLPPERRWVMEFRHPSWFTPAIYQLLGQHGVALCIPVGGQVQPDLVTTAPFTYVRMHAGMGPGGGFTPEQLRWWAGRLRGLRRAGIESYVYFNNDRGATRHETHRSCGGWWAMRRRQGAVRSEE